MNICKRYTDFWTAAYLHIWLIGFFTEKFGKNKYIEISVFIFTGNDKILVTLVQKKMSLLLKS